MGGEGYLPVPCHPFAVGGTDVAQAIPPHAIHQVKQTPTIEGFGNSRIVHVEILLVEQGKDFLGGALNDRENDNLEVKLHSRTPRGGCHSIAGEQPGTQGA